MTESDIKLGELILYICQKSANDFYFGSVKLNKLLYYSDFLAYAQWGNTITGAEYRNLREGPAPVRLVEVRDALLNENPPALAIQINQFPSYVQKKPVHLRPPNLSLFRGNELALVGNVIKENESLNGTQISNKSHHEWGWILTSEYETIKPASFLLAPDTERLSEEEIDKLLGNLAVTA
jgi:hypothetical protein